VTERRGARGPARTKDDDLGEMVSEAVAAFQDPFGFR
jgi:hypothetical protein